MFSYSYKYIDRLRKDIVFQSVYRSTALFLFLFPFSTILAKPQPAVATERAPNGKSVLDGGGGRIRTTEAFASDLQSDPFDRSGTPPILRR